MNDIEGGHIISSQTFKVEVYEDFCTAAMRCKSPTTEYVICNECTTLWQGCDSKMCCDHEHQITHKDISFKDYQIDVRSPIIG